MIEGRHPPACNFHKKDLAIDVKRSGTSSLWNHHKHCEKNPKNFDVKNQMVLEFKPKKEGDTKCGQLVGIKFNKEASTLALAKFILVDELSFRYIEHEGFREFVHVSQVRDIYLNSVWMRKRS